MTQPIDIRPHDLDIVRSILKDALPPEAKVWVFGSRATWATRDSSDLDLAIDAGRKLTPQEQNALTEGFEESDLPYKVDVVDWATTGETFRKIIERDRVELPWATEARGSWHTILLEEGLDRLIDYRGKSPPKSAVGVPVISAKVVKNGRIIQPIEQTIDPSYYPVWMTRGLPRVNETLEAMARAIFKDWFVDFGPTRAKMESRQPYLATDIWAFFPDQFDEEGKPAGWNAETLADLSDLNPESWTTRNEPDQVEYVDLANTKWGIVESTEIHLWKDAPSRARRVLRAGDTIVGTVRPGNGSYALIGRDGLTGSTGFAVLRPKRRHYRELIYCAATSPDNIDRLTHLADGGAYPAVLPDVVRDTELTVGSQRVIESFSMSCGPLIDRIEANKRESRTLTQTRDLLLPKLMSGEIRVRDAEKIAEAAA